MEKFLKLFVSSQNRFINFMRIAIFIVMAWIGGLKAFPYEADGIVPFVSNSPFMGFFYKYSGNKAINEKGKEVAEYTLYKNTEGKTVQKNVDWHTQNNTYVFSYGLGLVIIMIGILVLLGIWFPKIGFWGGFLTAGMSLVTLSFLITTPEVYVPNLGGDFPTPHYGFPYLSGAGRLVIKDIIMLAGGLIVASEAAKRILQKIDN
ncbi:DUF417 family protein [Chryseobacterium balustinum]|uniref:DUF417 family protein n=1 Tax=Chryseobacterium balustinum TaxID=246 RepID=UPI003CF5797A